MILAVGHLAFRKGQNILVQAFAKICHELPNWKLVLVGPESMDGCAAWIRDFCQKAAIESKVELIGSQENPTDWMKRSSIFVQPSLQEALGLALQEAMACGCACIGTNVGGIPELINDQRNGLLCAAADVTQLSKKLAFLIKRPDLRDQYGKTAVERIKALGMDRQSTTTAYQKIFEAHGKA